MTKRKFNIMIVVMLVFIVCFMVGSFAYDNIIQQRSDAAYEESLKNLDSKEQENASGSTSQEANKN